MPRRARSFLPWIVLAAVLAGQMACVARYGGDIPRADDWRDASVLLGDRPLTLKWLWSPHNVHRIPLPRLIRFVLYRSAGRDFRAAMFFSVTMMAVAAALMLRAAPRLRGSPSRLDVLLPLLLLGPAHFVTFLWGFQVQFAVSSALFFLAIGVVTSSRAPQSPGRLAVLGASILFQVLTGANGIALAAPLMVWLAAALAASRHDRRAAWWVAAAGLAVAAFVVAAYPFGLGGQWSMAPLVLIVGTFFQFLSTALIAAEPFWPNRALFVAALAAYGVVLVVRSFRTVPAERWRASGLLACFASVVLLGVFVAAGRAEMTIDAGLQSRYTTLAVALLVLVYFATLLYAGIRARTTVGVLLLAGAVLATAVGAAQAFGFGEFRRRQLQTLASDAGRGLSIAAIAARNGMTFNEYDPAVIRGALGSLRDHHAWPFEGYREDPRVHPQVVARTRLALEPSVRRDLDRDGSAFRPTGPRPQILLRLPRPAALAGIEVRYSVESARSRMMVLELHWGLTGGKDIDPASQRSGFPVFPTSEPRTVTAWVYDTIDTVVIVPDRTASRFQLHEVVLLELAPDWLP